jgi:hypothetical protein
MDARDNGGNNNPFSNPLCSLEWIACAMDAARRHKQDSSDRALRDDPPEGAQTPRAGEAV